MNNEVKEMWEEDFGHEILRVAVLKDFPDYLIFENGKVLDCKLTFEDPYDTSFNRRPRRIKFTKQKDGYPRANLRDVTGVKRAMYLHRLLALSFIENPEGKPQVNHINGIKTDFRIENLEWSTTKENIDHAIVTGLRSKGHLLNEDQVIEVKKRFEQGEIMKSVAADFPVSKSTLLRIKKGQSWAHIALG